MRHWLTQSSFSANSVQLRHDASNAATALRSSAYGTSQLHTVCAVLLVDAESANAALPSPDSQLNHVLASAYNALGDGANECYRAGANKSLRNKAIGFLEVGVGALAEGATRAQVVLAN
jgi:hypothetical protein